MQSVQKIEKMVEGYYKKSGLPPLPKGFKDFLADWVWLATLLGTLFGVLGVFGVLSTLFVAQSIIGVANYAGAGYATQLTGILWVSTAASLLFSVVMLVFQAKAITPLKHKKQSGWKLLFLVLLISFATNVVSLLFNIVAGGILLVGASLVGFAVSLLFYAIGLYLLFEIKPAFTKK